MGEGKNSRNQSGKGQEKQVAKETYPQLENFQDVTQKGILYTLEDGQVDAVIQDVTKAAKVPQYENKPLSAHDYISYVLVVEKEFAKTKAFEDFVISYNQAVEKLNQPEYGRKTWSAKGMDSGQADEFLPLELRQ